MQFLEKVAAASRWKRLPDRRGLPPRAFLNPADFQNGEAPGTAYAAPEFPKFAPPKWQAGIVEYVSEQEMELIFDDHLKNIRSQAWFDFCFEYGGKFTEARIERCLQRRIRRNKRAYNYWCGYVMGMKVAFAIASKFFSLKG